MKPTLHKPVCHVILLRRLLIGMISELVLWVGLILLVVFLTGRLLIYNAHHPNPNGETITVYFHDANQVTPGSPVDFMGTVIGYVHQVRIHGDRVAVQFKTFPRSLLIPPGARFTIEFNGLVGAKTLEVLPPEAPLSSPALLSQHQGPYAVEEPIRLKDLENTQIVMADALENSSLGIERSLGMVDDPAYVARQVDNARQALDQQTRHLGIIEETLVQQTRKVHHSLDHASHAMQFLTRSLETAAQWATPTSLRLAARQSLQSTTRATRQIYQAMTSTKTEARVTTFQAAIRQHRAQMTHLQEEVLSTAPRWGLRIDRFSRHLETLHPRLDRWQTLLSAGSLATWVEQARQRLHHWAQASERLDTRPSHPTRP